MKNRIIVPTILSLIIGSYLGFIIFKQYKNNSQTVFSEQIVIYFLQQGVYSSKESMMDNTKMLNEYIYTIEDNKYRVFVGMTTDKSNALKIEKIYNNKDINTYIKERNIQDMAFVEKLKQYDEIIRSSTDDIVILELQYQILNEYELVVKENK